MPRQVADRVWETVTVTGTGAITLGTAKAGGYLKFSAVCSVGDTAPVCVADSTAGVFEAGEYTYSATNTLTRTTVTGNSSGTTSLISFAGNTCDVMLDVTGAEAQRIAAAGVFMPSGFKSGSFYSFPSGLPTSGVTFFGNGYVYFTPFIVPKRSVLQSLGINLTGSASATANVWLAVYADTGGGVPGALVQGAKLTIANASAAGFYSITGMSQVLPPGLYWGMAQQDVNALTTMCWAPSAYAQQTHDQIFGATSGALAVGGSSAYTNLSGGDPSFYTALPNPAPSTTNSSSSEGPIIYWGF